MNKLLMKLLHVSFFIISGSLSYCDNCFYLIIIKFKIMFLLTTVCDYFKRRFVKYFSVLFWRHCLDEENGLLTILLVGEVWVVVSFYLTDKFQIVAFVLSLEFITEIIGFGWGTGIAIFVRLCLILILICDWPLSRLTVDIAELYCY